MSHKQYQNKWDLNCVVSERKKKIKEQSMEIEQGLVQVQPVDQFCLESKKKLEKL